MGQTVVVRTGLVGTVVDFLDQTGNTAFEMQAHEHVRVILQLAAEYTRGNGLVAGVPDKSIEMVVVTASARLLANPEQIEYQVGTVAIRGAFTGWSPLERIILNSYRRTAA